MNAIWTLILGAVGGYVAALIKFHFDTKSDQQRIKLESEHRSLEEQGKKTAAVEEEAWRRLQIAMDAVDRLYASGRSTPNLDTASNEELEEFLGDSILSPVQRDQIRRSSDKTRLLTEMLMLKETFDAGTAAFALRDYVRQEKLYLTSDLAEDFFACAHNFNSAVIDMHAFRQTSSIRPEPTFRQEGAKSLTEARRISLVIEGKLRERRERRNK